MVQAVRSSYHFAPIFALSASVVPHSNNWSTRRSPDDGLRSVQQYKYYNERACKTDKVVLFLVFPFQAWEAGLMPKISQPPVQGHKSAWDFIL
jgi:hypothetical protein